MTQKYHNKHQAASADGQNLEDKQRLSQIPDTENLQRESNAIENHIEGYGQKQGPFHLQVNPAIDITRYRNGQQKKHRQGKIG